MDVTPGVHNAVGEMVRDPRRDGAAAGGDGTRRVGQTGWRAKPTTGVARVKPTTGLARVKPTTGQARATRMSSDASSSSISIFI